MEEEILGTEGEGRSSDTREMGCKWKKCMNPKKGEDRPNRKKNIGKRGGEGGGGRERERARGHWQVHLDNILER